MSDFWASILLATVIAICCCVIWPQRVRVSVAIAILIQTTVHYAVIQFKDALSVSVTVEQAEQTETTPTEGLSQ